jgi:hypothetical protein
VGGWVGFRELVLGAEELSAMCSYNLLICVHVYVYIHTHTHRWELVLGAEELSAMDIAWQHLPVPDYSAPSLNIIIHGVRFIAEQVSVLVHVSVSHACIFSILSYMECAS